MPMLLILFTTTIFAQSKTNEKIKVFLDCNQEWLCDINYIKNELKMVDYVRDRFLSDVQVIMNTVFTNGGGESNVMTLVGQKNFSGLRDTFTYFNEATATESIKRNRMVKYLKIGLMPYVAKSPFADEIEIKYGEGTEEDKNKSQAVDPWNLWQFTLGANGFFNGDKNYSNADINLNLSANRETDKNNFSFFFNNNLERNKFTYIEKKEDGTLDTTIINAPKDRQNGFIEYTVKLNEHWAVGGKGRYVRSIFDNISTRVRGFGTVEYSLLPYTDFNSKRVVLSYSLGAESSNYVDTTIYLRKKEFLGRHSFAMTTSFVQKWGSINLGAEYGQYLNDFSKNSLFFGGGIDWNIVKGLKFAIGGNIQFQRDQISIPKAEADLVDLLTQRRIIASSYDYFVGVGFSYTFGSIFNSQVNPTFRGLNYNLNF